MSMVPEFSFLPPEINSARIFAGAGSGPLYMAAAAWDGLAADLQGSASSFDSVITALAGGPWAGPASVAMVAAAAPYVSWLSAAAGQAALSAGQARAAATTFETALAATVHPAAVTANRVSLMALIATNFLGQNTPAIAANEADYIEMWAQDVGAMLGYFTGATSVASTLTPFSTPPVDLAGLATQVGAQVAGFGSGISAGVVPIAQGAVEAAPALVAGVQSAIAAAPVQQLMSVAQIAAMPASMMMSPMMSLMQGANGAGAGMASAAAMGAADVPKFVGDVKPLGGVGGLGAGMAGDLGKAHLVGAMSVPPTWQGSVPKAMATSAMEGLGGMPNAAAMAQGAGASGGMPMMPMPMGAGGAQGGMPPGMGRGGAGSHVVQNRPSVIPRIGVG
jgi:PPE-repeat protein